MELDDPNGVIVVVVFTKIGLDGGDAVGGNALGHDVIAEEPEGEIDVVDGHVDEDAAGPCSVLDEEAGGVVFIAGLAADDAGSADHALVALVEGVPVGLVEPARESTHDFEMRLLLRRINNGLALHQTISFPLGISE